MGRLREIPRTAAFAWSTSIAQPLVATGTRAGALDADFSNETRLEIWDLNAAKGSSSEIQPLASAQTDSRFFDIAWSQPTKEHPSGVIAGGLENGSLDLWDAAKLIENKSDAHITRTTVHTGPIKALQFNPHRPELLATCGAKGELYITDLNNPQSPYRVGGTAVRSDDFDCLDWNKRVPHILVTGSSAGFVTVWDVKKKAENLTLNNYNRKPVSAVAWHPDEPTKLVTAISTDQEPLILLWQLRNTSQPEKIFRGHDQGVLSLSWCPQDSGLLLSCGKDNRNICWDADAAQILGEFPIVTNWTFQTRFNPVHPDIFATASFDGKIIAQSLQSTKTTTEDKAAAVDQAADGADFFAQAQVQPVGSTFSLSKAPKWLRRPVGVSFGFGGKLVRFHPDPADAHKSTLAISTFTTDTGVETSITEFGAALKDSDVIKICDARIESAANEATKEDWKVMKTLVAEKPRKELLKYLGFEQEAKPAGEVAEKETTNGDTTAEDAAKKENRLSAFFEGTGEGQNFLTDLAASKGARTNKPFHIFTGSESETDKTITRALMLGSFEDALDICIKEKRMSDAFMIAICGGQKCIDKAQAAYFAQQTGAPNYLRLLASVVGKNLWDVVYNADLENWREVLATLCTFADETEFPDLCEALGDRLEESSAPQKDASFCFLAGSKLEKLVPIWIKEMQKDESSNASSTSDDSEFAIHVKALQGLIEKISIFRKATHYEDKDGLDKTSDWKLEPLYEKYAEYADVVASQGHLDLAEQFLALLPAGYPAAEIARNRLKQATKKAVMPSLQTQQRPAFPAVPTSRTPVSAVPSYGARGASPYAPTNAFVPQPNAYTPPAPAVGANPYAPAAPNFNTSASPPPAAGLAPPPGGPAQARAVNGNNWNDLPDTFAKSAPPRRSTPSVPPAASPYAPGPSSSYGFPGAAATPPPPPGASQRASPSLPPPPKIGQPPRTSSPLVDRSNYAGAQQPLQSAATNAYAPPPTAQSYAAQPPPVAIPPRGASPYNPPPTSSAPSSNRYAPAPGTAPSPIPGGPQFPTGRPSVAPGPYNPQGGVQSPAAAGPPMGAPAPPPARREAPAPAPPPQGPPRGGPPRAAPAAAATPPPVAAATSYPAGDRSHIPANAQPVYDILHKEMQRIKGLAPANYKPQVDDTEKRLNLLFDALNNSSLASGSIDMLTQLSQSLQARNFDQAQSLYGELVKQVEQSSMWMVGIKRLISMSRATPVS